MLGGEGLYWGMYVGASFDEIKSANSGGSSSKRKPCWGVAWVNRILCAAWVDILYHWKCREDSDSNRGVQEQTLELELEWWKKT